MTDYDLSYDIEKLKKPEAWPCIDAITGERYCHVKTYRQVGFPLLGVIYAKEPLTVYYNPTTGPKAKDIYSSVEDLVQKWIGD